MLSLISALTLNSATAVAQPPDPVHQCQSLAARLDQTIFVTASSELVPAKALMPAYCRVRGTIRPTIGFEMRLPVERWNGNFYQAGCGGFCGQMTPETPGYANGIVASVQRGYASIHTDSGHPGPSQGYSAWARDDRAAVDLYAHGWIPKARAAGLAIATSYYGRAPRYRYLVGCSNGGRIGLIAAQRYPTLFHGIVSGCPALDLTGSGGAFGAWKLRTNRDDATPVLTADFVRKLPFLTAAINAQCDGLDGQADGLIARPAACRINYDLIRACPPAAAGEAAATDCLTAEEKNVVQLWHQGPRTSRGQSIFGGMPAGSEQFWKIWYLRPAAEAVGTQLADGFTRHIVFDPARPDFSATSFDFDRDPARLSRDFATLNATSPNLSAFRAAGGKLLMWHGLADPLVVPSQSADYYRQVLKTMGGKDRVQRFFRYFEAPGLGHCWEAPSQSAPEEFDPLTAIENWVERGVAPQEIVARPSPRQGEGLTIREIRYRPFPAAPRVGPAA